MKRAFVLIFLSSILTAAAWAQSADTSAEKPKDQEATPQLSAATADTDMGAHKWSFSVGGGFSLGSSATFADVSCTNCFFDSYDTNYRYSQALTFLAEARWSRPHSWGFNFGAAYDTSRKADNSVTVDGNDTVASNSKLEVGMIYANAIYQWGGMYLPFGFNYDIVKFTPDDSYDGSYQASGGLGTQVGFGYNFDDHWSIEGDLRLNALKLNSEGSDGDNVDFGTGYLATATVTGRFTF